jgi:quercetin dioxygenase-like cupin family protein
MPSITTLDELTDTPTAPVFEAGSPRAVRLSLDPDESVPPHRHPEATVIFHLIEGQITFSVDDEPSELDAGDVARIEGDRRVSIQARTSSRALIVLCPWNETDPPVAEAE